MVCPFAFLLLLPGAKPLLASLLNGVLADKIINVSHARPWALIVGCVFLFVSIAFYQRLLSSAVVEATPSFVPDTQFGVDAAKVREFRDLQTHVPLYRHLNAVTIAPLLPQPLVFCCCLLQALKAPTRKIVMHAHIIPMSFPTPRMSFSASHRH